MPKLVLIYLIILLQIQTIMSVSKMDLIKIAPVSAAASTAPAAAAPAGMVHIRVVSRHSGDAGGDVILGGFAVAVVAAVVCYIRATRKTTIHQPGALTIR
ncbi:hypothetical protein RND81_10G018500 [Saponaria officinalis]|uniref:Uncharacterized protein n=1 Tax=Saponaria officinalis TaxID=3572 RepID=A0AAW1HZN2_SAPOF